MEQLKCMELNNMPRYHLKAVSAQYPDGRVPFTAQEELDRDTEEAMQASLVEPRAWVRVRAIRNQLLSETDYTQVDDSLNKGTYKAYRAELRNLPQTYPDSGVALLKSWDAKQDEVNPVDDGKWPTKPGT